MNIKQENIATDSREVIRRHSDNRKAWNEAAASYSRSNSERVALLKSGQSSLHPVERQNLMRLGAITTWCKRAIHLQCASGGDSLSLVLEGVHEVIGIDISEAHISNAMWTSEQLRMPAQWFCCDVLDSPVALNESVDLVYTGQGAINWIHDIDAWARVVARLLRKNGVVSVLEDHPITWLFQQDSETLQPSGLNYFSHAENSRGWTDEYIGSLDKPKHQLSLKHERLWTIADVLQALLKASLTIEFFGEHAEEYWPIFPRLNDPQKRSIPMTYSLIARK
jgi:SAM-dependent methyltransferase